MKSDVIMGGLKLALVVLLVSVSVRGQDPIVNEDERTVSDVDNVIDGVEPETAAEVVDDTLSEVVSETEPLQIRSGKYQLLNDGLTGEEPINLDAVSFDFNGQQSEKQLLIPSTTATTNNNNEYGKYKQPFFIDIQYTSINNDDCEEK